MTAVPALQRIHQIAIHVQDIARAVGFYRDTLGLTLLFQAPPQLAFFDCGGVRLMLAGAEAQPSHSTSILYCYFAVADIKASHMALAAAGVRFRSEPHLIAKLPDREVWL